MKKIFLMPIGLIALVLSFANVSNAQVFHVRAGSEVRIPVNTGETITIICEGPMKGLKMQHTGFIYKEEGDTWTTEQIDMATGRWMTIEMHRCTVMSEPGRTTCPPTPATYNVPGPVGNVYYFTLSRKCGESGVREIMLSAN
jgi:hypothetical protein